MDGQTGQISELLAGCRKGDRGALDRLVPLIRPELYRLARLHLGREQENCTMQPSSLVPEAFLRLLPHASTGWNDRAHFLAAASRVMRHVLVDYARERRRIKRGGGAVHINVDDAVVLSADQVVEVDLALQRLTEADARKPHVFEMRFFGEMSVEETADVLEVAPNTVIRDRNFARTWLSRELRGARTTDCGTLGEN
jgi:RNA polymerase sigma factor (TIGR02999 family)